jgi:anti-sigma factor RsiW
MRILRRFPGHRADDCERVARLLSAYADGELDSGARKRVERHLALCPPCQRALRSLRLTLAGLRRLANEDTDDEATAVVERLLAGVRQSS